MEWARAKLRHYLWSKQREIIQSLRDNKKTAVHSCFDVGKSFVAGLGSCWWVDTHPPAQTLVVSTAPTDQQVKAILWTEMNHMHELGNLGGKMNLKEWYIGKRQVGFGRKPSEHNVAAFSGYHRRFLLAVIDEASGVPAPIWDAVEGITQGPDCRILAIGNPYVPDGPFFEACQPGSGWNVIHIGYADTPNFTGEDIGDDLASVLIGREWVEDRREHWGEDSALFVSKVLGLFPTDDVSFKIVPLAWAQPCRLLDLPDDGPREAGLDVGAGGDRTVLRERRGQKVGREATWTDADPMRQVGNIAAKLAEWGIEKVKIDWGMGWALGGRLQELSSRHNVAGKLRGETTHDAEIVMVQFGERSSDPKRWLNVRAEMYWNFRELCRLKVVDLSDPSIDDDCMAELTTANYEIVDSRGCIKVEPKDDIVKRLKRSPDRADAMVLAFHDHHSEVRMASTEMLTSARIGR